jgi:hypothetical protein
LWRFSHGRRSSLGERPALSVNWQQLFLFSVICRTFA